MESMKIHYYLQNEKGYKIYRSSLDIAEDKKLPSTAVKDIDFPLPEAIENCIRILTPNGWGNILNYTDKWYDKETKSEKLWEIGETPDDTKYTTHKPIEEESFQKLTTNGWIIDTEAKDLADKKKQKSQILAQVNIDLENGIEYTVNGISHTFQATKDSITDMNNMSSDVEFLGSTWIGFWRSKENIKVNMTYIQFKEMAKIAGELYKQKFTESRDAIDLLGL